MEKPKKVYESKKTFSIKYNKQNINVLVDRQLIDLLKEKLKDTNTSLKSYLENLIQSDLDK
jgi:hypothetical protein